MSPIWLPATAFAGCFQAWRTALQQRLRATLSVNAAGLARYLYGFAVALVLLGSWLAIDLGHVPALSPGFFAYAITGGTCQIIGTNFLIMAFGYRNFVVGAAYAKTGAVQGALFSAGLLHDVLSPLMWFGIAVGVIGVIIFSTGGRRLGPLAMLREAVQPAALCGLGAGLLFALASIFICAATRTLATPDLLLRALVALAVTVASQAILQGLYVAIREPAQLRAVAASLRNCRQVGILKAVGSAGWFTGFATTPVALVRTVGQVEVIFTLLVGRFYLRKALCRSAAAGSVLVAIGMVLAVIGA